MGLISYQARLSVYISWNTAKAGNYVRSGRRFTRRSKLARPRLLSQSSALASARIATGLKLIIGINGLPNPLALFPCGFFCFLERCQILLRGDAW